MEPLFQLFHYSNKSSLRKGICVINKMEELSALVGCSDFGKYFSTTNITPVSVILPQLCYTS